MYVVVLFLRRSPLSGVESKDHLMMMVLRTALSTGCMPLEGKAADIVCMYVDYLCAYI